MAPLSQGVSRGCPWPEFAEQYDRCKWARCGDALVQDGNWWRVLLRKLDFQRRRHRVLEHSFGGTAAKIIIVLLRISGMIVIAGLLLGGLRCIVQFVGLRGDDVCNEPQASSSRFA